MTNPAFLGGHAVFVDTSGFVALLADRDGRHADATVVQARLIRDRGAQLVTTNFVLTEMHALLLARVGRQHAIRALLGIDRSDTVVVRVVEEKSAGPEKSWFVMTTRISPWSMRRVSR